MPFVHVTYTEHLYMISSKVQEKTVFWMVKKSDQGYQLKATETSTDAALFRIDPIGDPAHPFNFHIAYWDTREYQHTTHVNNGTSKQSLSLHYLSADTDMLGRSNGSLSLKTTVDDSHSCFCLYKIESGCVNFMSAAIPVDLSEWFDDEQFYIGCSYHSQLKMNGYLAVVKEAESNSYKVTTVFSAAGQDPSEIGMLFQLHQKAKSSVSESAKLSSITAQTTEVSVQ